MAPFISFEGGEGSGKSLQARALYRQLSRRGISARLVHEPGSTALGRVVRRWLKWSHSAAMSPLTELLMFNASRAQLVAEVIRPDLANGITIVCDRFTDSTVAYQGYGRGLDIDTVRHINDIATGGLYPDLVVLLDIMPEVGLARKRGGGQDRFEQEDTGFHRKVRQGFLTLARSEPKRWLVVDAGQSKRKVTGLIWERVSRLPGIQGDSAGKK